MTPTLAPLPPAVVDAEEAALDLAFAVQRNPGAYALLLGAGVSTEAGLPSAWDVQLALLAQAAAARGVHLADPAAWWRRRTGREPRYDDLVDALAPTPAERQALLRGFFEPTAEEREAGLKSPSGTHRAIARLVAKGYVRILVTLNFDHLIETALRDAGVVPTVVGTPAEFAAMLPLHTQRALVVHLHGDYTDPSSMRNTGDELRDYDPRTRELIGRIAAEYGLVLTGWSGAWDPALREVLAAHPNRFFSGWWITPFPLGEPAERLRALRRDLVIAEPAATALGRLADSVDAIEATAARHPRSAAVAVAAAKRALQGAGRAIPLHDELLAEFGRLAAHPVRLDRTAGRGDLDGHLDAVREASAVLAALVATTAYWGDDDTDGWWLGELQRLAAADGAPGPLAGLPAAVLFVAGGAAAVAGRRFGLAHALLATVTIRKDDVSLGAAEALAADRVLPAAHGSAWLAGTARQALGLALGLSAPAALEAWELFAYLQLLERAVGRVPAAVLDELRPLAAAAWAAQPRSAGPLVVGAGPEEAALRRAIRALVRLELPAPHLRGGGYGGRTAPRVSAALRRDLELQAEEHPLVRAGFAGGSLCGLRTMISIVDDAVGRAARSALDRASAADDAWLDGRAD